jgi:hypothetical protein
MFSSTQPSQAFASAPSGTASTPSGWASEMDDYALDCECADPALQIASWGQDAGEAVQAAAVS